MRSPVLFVTGTDTGVGKTVLTCLLTRHLRALGRRVAALKPLCSGGRDDARAIHSALGGSLTLDEINPWHFAAPLAPSLAARREGRRVRLSAVLTHARSFRSRHDLVVIEGAGGLLSPLGDDFNARDLIVQLRAVPVIVCPNRLGAINQLLLVLAALPPASSRRAHLVLMSPTRHDAASRSNPGVLCGMIGSQRVHVLPSLPEDGGMLTPDARRVVRRICKLIPLRHDFPRIGCITRAVVSPCRP